MSDSTERLIVLLGGTVLSVAAALLSYVGAGKDVVLSTVVGLQVEAISLLVEVLLTMSRRQHLAGRAGRLMERLERIPELAVQFDEISKDLFNVREKYQGTIAPERAERIMAQCQSQIGDLSKGHLSRDSYDPTIKMQLLGQRAGILRTTSLQSHDLAWHQSDVGRIYWRSQLDAMARGWKIERIFIYHDWSRELNDLALEQLRHGVSVYRISQRNTPRELQVDFSIWNSNYAYRQWVREVEGLPEDLFMLEAAEIATYFDRWERLHALSEKCSEELLSAATADQQPGS